MSCFPRSISPSFPTLSPVSQLCSSSTKIDPKWNFNRSKYLLYFQMADSGKKLKIKLGLLFLFLIGGTYTEISVKHWKASSWISLNGIAEACAILLNIEKSFFWMLALKHTSARRFLSCIALLGSVTDASPARLVFSSLSQIRDIF